MEDQKDLTDIHIRWNNGDDLIITVSLTKDSIGTIKQLVKYFSFSYTSFNKH